MAAAYRFGNKKGVLAPKLEYLAESARTDWEHHLLFDLKEEVASGVQGSRNEWQFWEDKFIRREEKLRKLREMANEVEEEEQLWRPHGEAKALSEWFKGKGQWLDQKELDAYREYQYFDLAPLDLTVDASDDESGVGSRRGGRGFFTRAGSDVMLDSGSESGRRDDDADLDGARAGSGGSSSGESSDDDAMDVDRLLRDKGKGKEVLPDNRAHQNLPTPLTSTTPTLLKNAGDDDSETDDLIILDPTPRLISPELETPDIDQSAARARSKSRVQSQSRSRASSLDRGKLLKRRRGDGDSATPRLPKRRKLSEEPYVRKRPKTTTEKRLDEVQTDKPLSEALEQLGFLPSLNLGKKHNINNPKAIIEVDFHHVSFRTTEDEHVPLLTLSKWRTSDTEIYSYYAVRGLVRRRDGDDSDEGDVEEAEVQIFARDVVDLLSDSDNGLVLVTKDKTRLRIVDFDRGVPKEHIEELRLLANWFVVAFKAGIANRHRKDDKVTQLALQSTLDDNDENISTWLDSLHSSLPAYKLRRPLTSYSLSSHSEILSILHNLLPTPLYVTPTIYDLVAHHLAPNALRTDSNHDVAIGAKKRRKEENLLKTLKKEVVDAGASKCVPVEESRLEEKKRRTTDVLAARIVRAVDPVQVEVQGPKFERVLTAKEILRATDEERLKRRVMSKVDAKKMLKQLEKGYRLNRKKRRKGKNRRREEETNDSLGLEMFETFTRALVNDEEICAGDTVLIAGNESEQGNKESEEDDKDDEDDEGDEDDDSASSTKPSGCVPWIFIVSYFQRKKKKLFVHGRWLRAERDSRIGSVGSPRAFEYADHCDSVGAATIVRKMDIALVDAHSPVPETGFYCSHAWDKDIGGGFVDFEPLEDYKTVGATYCALNDLAHCPCCERRLAERAHTVRDKLVEEPEGGKKKKKAPSGKSKEDAAMDRPVWLQRASHSSPEAFVFADETYHRGDYVYMYPSNDRRRFTQTDFRPTLRLGRILRIGFGRQLPNPLERDTQLTISLILRRDEVFSDDGRTDDRRLLLTDHTFDIDVEDLQGKFRLIHRDKMLSRVKQNGLSDAKHEQYALAKLAEDDSNLFWTSERLHSLDVDNAKISWLHHFKDPLRDTTGHDKLESERATAPLVTSLEKDDVPSCKTCADEVMRSEEREEKAKAMFEDLDGLGKLRALSLFSGKDGLGDGLVSTLPFMSVVAAVESDPEVSKLLQANHAKLGVRTTKVDLFVEKACLAETAPNSVEFEGAAFAPLARNDVDVIFGGPPCQSFSIANFAKVQDDPRGNQIFALLSAVDFFRPLFVLIENVRALQDVELSGGGTLLHLVETVLKQLRYQVRTGVYQAAAMGTPQVRRRLFIIASRQGCALPAAPQPTHSFTDSNTTMNAEPFDNGADSHQAVMSHRVEGVAPHPAVTFEKAMLDLPVFGYSNPYDEKSAPAPGTQWHPSKPLGLDEAPYASDPSSTFQRSMRIATGFSRPKFEEVVSGHVTAPGSEMRAARLSLLGVKGDAKGSSGNYLDIPESIRVKYSDKTERVDCRPPLPPRLLGCAEKETVDYWTRADANSLSTPLRTSLIIDGVSHGPRIHYEQKRTFSHREFNRMQGYPDRFSVGRAESLSHEAVMRATGNGVPFPLAASFGREIHRVVVPTFLHELKTASNDRNIWTQLRSRLNKDQKLSIASPNTDENADILVDSESEEEIDEEAARRRRKAKGKGRLVEDPTPEVEEPKMSSRDSTSDSGIEVLAVQHALRPSCSSTRRYSGNDESPQSTKDPQQEQTVYRRAGVSDVEVGYTDARGQEADNEGEDSDDEVIVCD